MAIGFNSNKSSINNNLWLRLRGSAVLCLIVINVAVYLLIGLVNILSHGNITLNFALLWPLNEFISQPWGILTYMFLQSDFLNLLFNMMWLWAFGALLSRFGSGKILVWTYLVSGLAGAVFFIVTAQIKSMPLAILWGSSASVLGIIAGTAAQAPRFKINLFLFGEVEIRWVALFAIILCGIAPGLGNTPTLLAHIGGIVGGYLFVLFMNRKGFKLKFNKSGKQYKSSNVRQQQKRGLSPSEQRELDTLLDKVKKSGFKSLTMSQRSRLFELSKHINK